MKADLQVFLLISNNPSEIKKTQDGYELVNPEQYPLIQKMLNHTQENNQFSVRNLVDDNAGKIHAWIYNGVMSALYTSGQYEIGGSADPLVLTSLIKEAGVKPDHVLKGSSFPEMMKLFGNVERMLEFKTPKAEINNQNKLSMFKAVLMLKEMGKSLSDKEKEFVHKHKSEFDFYQKTASEKFKELEKVLKEHDAVWESFQRELLRNPGFLDKTLSPQHAISTALLDVKEVFQAQMERELERQIHFKEI